MTKRKTEPADRWDHTDWLTAVILVVFFAGLLGSVLTFGAGWVFGYPLAFAGATAWMWRVKRGMEKARAQERVATEDQRAREWTPSVDLDEHDREWLTAHRDFARHPEDGLPWARESEPKPEPPPAITPGPSLSVRRLDLSQDDVAKLLNDAARHVSDSVTQIAANPGPLLMDYWVTGAGRHRSLSELASFGVPPALRNKIAEKRGEAITCPVCDRTSYSPHDVEEGYCGNCHRWTRDLSPAMVLALRERKLSERLDKLDKAVKRMEES